MRGTESECSVALLDEGLYGDDRRRTGNAGSLNGADADAPAAHDYHRLAGGHACRVGHGSRACQDPAAQQRGLDQVHVVGDPHHLGAVYHHLGGEGGDVQALGDPGSGGVGQRAPTVQRQVTGAGHVTAPATGLALAAGADQRDDHRIADCQVGYTVADLGDVS